MIVFPLPGNIPSYVVRVMMPVQTNDSVFYMQVLQKEKKKNINKILIIKKNSTFYFWDKIII